MFFNTCINIFTHSPKKFGYFSQFFMALTSEPHCSMRTLSQFWYHFDFYIYTNTILHVLFAFFSGVESFAGTPRTIIQKIITGLQTPKSWGGCLCFFYVNIVHCKYMFYNKNSFVSCILILRQQVIKAYYYFWKLPYFRGVYNQTCYGISLTTTLD